MNTLQGEKYLWILPEGDSKKILHLAAAYNISFSLIQTLVSRGFSTEAELNDYLFSSVEKDVAHPSLMKDSQRAVDRIIQAIEHKEKILVFGDYDVDGITASALMMACLLPLGAKINFYLPRRGKDDYGISTKIVQRADQNKYKVIITVDNGITAFDAADEAKKTGIDLIITDHHQPHESVPDAYALVNPHQNDCSYPYKYLAGVGVTFKLLSLLYEQKKMPMPPKVYELLMLGTIADVVPLTGENRFWVRYGLQSINKIESLAFKVLKQNISGIKPKLSSLDIGFSIAPQINALGRLEDPRIGVQFLIESDYKGVERVGKILGELNRIRKKAEHAIFSEVETEIKKGTIDLERENIIIAAHNAWPPGIIGLVASRLVSTYGKPAFLFHIKDDIAEGSCRSIPQFNIFEALKTAGHLIERFGGHTSAAGLRLKMEHIASLKALLEELIVQQLSEFDLKQKITLDAQVNLIDLTKKFVNDMEYLEPFGHENEQPSFHIKDVVLVQKPLLLKDLHVKCSIFADGIIKPVIFFNRPDLFQKLMMQENEPFDLAARVSENYWNRRLSIELIGLDVAKLKEIQ